MEKIRNFVERWGSIIVLVVMLLSVWIGLEIAYNFEKIKDLDISKRIIYIGKDLVEFFLFILVVKIVIASDKFLNSFQNIFKNIYKEKDFLKILSHNEQLDIAKKINELNEDIQIDLINFKNTAYNKVRNEWREDKPYIILESHYLDTLYSNGTLISHKVYKIEIMKSGKIEINYRFLPFDKNVAPYLEDEQPLDRWTEKSFKYTRELKGVENTPLYANLKKDEEGWFFIRFYTEKPIKEGTIVEFEFSISDKINLTKDGEERRKEYFQTRFSQSHGIRYISFQLERYYDVDQEKLSFIPVLNIDESNVIDDEYRPTHTRNIYYDTFSWCISITEKKPKNIVFELHEK